MKCLKRRDRTGPKYIGCPGTITCPDFVCDMVPPKNNSRPNPTPWKKDGEPKGPR